MKTLLIMMLLMMRMMRSSCKTVWSTTWLAFVMYILMMRHDAKMHKRQRYVYMAQMGVARGHVVKTKDGYD